MKDIKHFTADLNDEDRYHLINAFDSWRFGDYFKYNHLFEKELAHKFDRKYALFVPHCTHAIHLGLLGLGVGPGDEVIVPECTWIASVAPVVWCGATPVFADLDPDNWCVDFDEVENRITNKTKAIIAVNLYGNMANWTELESIAAQYGVPLLEDAAESIGSYFKERPSGDFGDLSVFSFHRSKTMTTGEGGALLLDDPVLYERCQFLRNHGRPLNSTGAKCYFNDEVAYKYFPSNLQAALGYSQLLRLNKLVDRKREIFGFYRKHLPENIQMNEDNKDVFNSFWLPTAVFDRALDRDALIDRLAQRGIPTRPFFYPLTDLPAFKMYQESPNPYARSVSYRGINLPGDLTLTEEDVAEVCSVVMEEVYGVGK